MFWFILINPLVCVCSLRLFCYTFFPQSRCLSGIQSSARATFMLSEEFQFNSIKFAFSLEGFYCFKSFVPSGIACVEHLCVMSSRVESCRRSKGKSGLIRAALMSFFCRCWCSSTILLNDKQKPFQVSRSRSTSVSKLTQEGDFCLKTQLFHIIVLLFKSDAFDWERKNSILYRHESINKIL